MDFGGRWRLLHYSMKATYAPFLVSAHHNRSEGSFHVWATSDMTHSISGLQPECYHCMTHQRDDIDRADSLSGVIHALSSESRAAVNLPTCLS